MKTTEPFYSPVYSLETVEWSIHGKELYEVRHTVFVEEQGIAEHMEQDEFDPQCWHVLARDATGRPIGTGRLLRDGHIGRVAVLKSWRGRGLGRALMKELMRLARAKGFTEIELSAQIQALDFYQSLGFVPHGSEYLEVDIPHIRMRQRLGD